MFKTGRQSYHVGVSATPTLTLNCVLDGIADVDRLRVIGRHQAEKAVDQIRHVLERTGLLAVAVNLSAFHMCSASVRECQSQNTCVSIS